LEQREHGAKVKVGAVKEKFYRIPGYSEYLISKSGNVFSIKRNRLLKFKSFKGKYTQVSFYINGKGLTVHLHRLLAITFLKNRDNHRNVNHKNAEKSDNRLENLEWLSQSKNVKHAYTLGLAKPASGEINGMHKLKERQVLEIKKLLENSNDTEIAKLYNVSRRCICKIRNGKSWKHV